MKLSVMFNTEDILICKIFKNDNNVEHKIILKRGDETTAKTWQHNPFLLNVQAKSFTRLWLALAPLFM